MADVTVYLEAAGADFDVLEHDRTERAAEEATALGVAPAEVAKTLVLDAPSGHVRAVVPASQRIDLHKVAAALGVAGKKVQLASEEELARDYPEFELGAVPPFGGRDDPVIVDERVASRDSVVLEAGSGEEALEVVARHEVDLVIMDQSMPGMSGTTCIGVLRERRPGLEVVAFTSTPDGEAAFLRAGAAAHFTKPEVDPLIAFVRERADGRDGARDGRDGHRSTADGYRSGE